MTLAGADTQAPYFTPTLAGEYVFELVATDETSAAAQDSVTISVPKLGDINRDGQIDSADLQLVTSARDTPSSERNDLRDLNGDGRIDALDARILVNTCTYARCATK